MKKIFYIGNFDFPNGNASGLRVLNNGFLFEKLGFNVSYIGVNNSLPFDSYIFDTKDKYGEKEYYNLPYPTSFKGWLSYNKRFKEVVSVLEQQEGLVAVIAYGSPTLSFFGKKLRDWCRGNDVRYLVDNVDWFSGFSGSLVHRLVKGIDDNYQKRILNSSSDGVIAISSFLSEYYKGKGKTTVVIPPLVNFYDNKEKFKITSTEKEPIKFIYVGVPFGIERNLDVKYFKDRLDIAIRKLYVNKSNDFIFNIYGLTKEQYLTVLPKDTEILSEFKDKVLFHGKVDNVTAKKKISESDFTILLRHVNRTTTAGFPTKAVESISCGTPLITTDTSDLKKYIVDGANGFFVDLDVTNGFDEIFKMSRVEINRMKEYSYKSKLFHFENFHDDLFDFMNKIGL